MPLYSVLVTQDITQSGSVIVRAASEDEAEALAVQAVRAGSLVPMWMVDDATNGEIYIGDPGYSAELEDEEDSDA